MEGIGGAGMHAAGNPSVGDERGSDAAAAAAADRSLAAFRGRRGAEEKARKAKFERKRGGKKGEERNTTRCVTAWPVASGSSGPTETKPQC